MSENLRAWTAIIKSAIYLNKIQNEIYALDKMRNMSKSNQQSFCIWNPHIYILVTDIISQVVLVEYFCNINSNGFGVEKLRYNSTVVSELETHVA